MPLDRNLGLPKITLFGLGTVIGAGIYVLLGEVVTSAGVLAPVSFLLAAILAGFSAFSFAELSARIPQSAGEALYVYEAFGSRAFSTLIGLLVVSVGCVACATLANGFVGYATSLFSLPPLILIVGFVGALGMLAAWGIKESAWVAAAITVVEVGGLAVVIVFAALAADPANFTAAPSANGLTRGMWLGVFGGTLLAFFAYAGFEDMVNVAEEVKDVRRILPLAIIITLVASFVIYHTLALVVIFAVPTDLIAGSEAPIALVFEYTTGWSATPISVVGILAVVNGALVQIIMASRVLYGLARSGQLPRVLAAINDRTDTPLKATALVTAAVLGLALWLPLVALAKITSLIVLLVFTAVNLALIVIKRRDPSPEGITVYPAWLPWAGLVTSGGFVGYQLFLLVG